MHFNPQNILVMDTAMSGCSVAFFCGETGTCVVRSQDMPRGQSEALVPMVQDVMKEAPCGFEGLDSVVSTIGPGAFTGLRIGLSAAKSFALALDIPLWGVTTCQALAFDYVEKTQQRNPFTVLIESRRKDFYMQKFEEQGKPVSEPFSKEAFDIAAESGEGCIFIGDALERFREMCEVGRGPFVFDQNFTLPNPEAIARAFADQEKRKSFFTDVVHPIYLRAPDVSQPKTPPRRLKK